MTIDPSRRLHFFPDRDGYFCRTSIAPEESIVPERLSRTDDLRPDRRPDELFLTIKVENRAQSKQGIGV